MNRRRFILGSVAGLTAPLAAAGTAGGRKL